jgi:hypothetical protein
LKSIELCAFSWSSLKSIDIPPNVQFIDGSAFAGIESNCVSIEAGHQQFSIENEFLVDVINQRLIRNFSSSSSIPICSDIEILGSSCFSFCKSLSSVLFESHSRLRSIESHAFSWSSLTSIEIPRNVEIVESSCFCQCTSLSSISFESNSRLRQIKNHAFYYCPGSMIVPSSILYISWNAVEDSSQISIGSLDCCPEYGRWQRLLSRGIIVDFRRIRRFGSGFLSLSDCFFAESDLKSCTNQSGGRIEVTSVNLSRCVDEGAIEKGIETLMNLRHPCIAGVIGVFDPRGLQELRIVRNHLCHVSLSRVVSTSPTWWTPTAKAKAIVGLVLGLRFAHSFGLVHGHLTGNTVFLSEDGMIEICDFGMTCSGELESEECGFSREDWTPESDVQAFTKIQSEIISGASAEQRRFDQPAFATETSFANILETLKTIEFTFIEGANSREVSDFVSWIEWSERLAE